MADYRLLVFDWDGTLMDSEGRIIASVRAACEAAGLAPPEDARIRNIIGLALREAWHRLYPGEPEDRLQQFIEEYRKHFFHGPHQPVALFEGAAETLQRLADAGYLMAVATGKSRRGLDREMRASGLDSVFHTSRCADEAPSKPAPQMLEYIIEELDVTPAETIMIGDTEYDLAMARAAGAHRIGVSYGAHEAERLLQFEPLTVIDTIEELPAWLQAAPPHDSRG